MTRSLAGIEPMNAGCSDNVSLCLSECIAMVDPFVPPPDSAAAEIFQSAMADDGAFVAVGRDAPIAPHGYDGVAPMRRREGALPCQSAVLQPRNAQNHTEHNNVPPSQNVVKPHEVTIDSHDPVQVIALAPLPIELPVAAVQQQSAASVATPDTVKMFVAAAEAVADAILVSSGFENGEGRILVRLQPEVLGGSEIQITVKGGTLTVVVNPASQDVQMIVEANRTQFEQHLAEKVHSWRVAVAVKKGDKADERV